MIEIDDQSIRKQIHKYLKNLVFIELELPKFKR